MLYPFIASPLSFRWRDCDLFIECGERNPLTAHNDSFYQRLPTSLDCRKPRSQPARIGTPECGRGSSIIEPNCADNNASRNRFCQTYSPAVQCIARNGSKLAHESPAIHIALRMPDSAACGLLA